MYRDLIIIALSLMTWGFGEGIFLFSQPIYLQSLGADPIRIGAILGALGLTMTIAHIPAGYLADRLGRKPLLVTAWLMGTAAAGIMALARTLPVFVAGMLIYGLTFFVSSPLSSYVTAARGQYSVGRIITLISSSYSLGGFIGPWLGGWIGNQYGIRQAYFVAVCVFATSTAIILLARKQPVEPALPARSKKRWIFSPAYFLFLGVVFLSAFAMYLPQPLTSNFLNNERNLSLEQIGRLYSLTYIGIVVLNLILGQLPARIGFVLGQAAVGIFAISLWRGSGLLWYSAGFFLLGGARTARAMATAQVRELADEANMGLAYGLGETVGASAIILAPVLTGYLYSINPTWMYPLGAGLIGVSMIVSACFSPARLGSQARRLSIQTDISPGGAP